MQAVQRLLKLIVDRKSYTVWLLIILGFCIYLNSLGNPMFWDDLDNISNNKYVHSFAYFKNYFSENLIAGSNLHSNYWRPMMLFTWASGYAMWGNSAGGFRFVNISLHIFNAILVYFLIVKLFKNRIVALSVSLVFLVHPLQTEAITYVSGISDPLSGLFMLTGLILGLKSIGENLKIGWKSFIGSVVCFALALMTRETALIIFPMILILSLYFRLLSLRVKLAQQIQILIQLFAPIGLVGVIYFILRATVLDFGGTFNLYQETNEFTGNIGYRILTFFRVVTQYFEILFFPNNLHMERSIEVAKSFWHLDVVLGATIFAVTSGVSVFTFKTYRLISFGIIWFWVTVFPVSNILIPVNALMYEHWMYLPLIGAAVTVSGFVGWLVGKYRKLISPVVLVCIIYISFLSVKTIYRNSEWGNPIYFYNQVLQYSPGSLRIWNNLGMEYANVGDSENAIRAYAEAIKLDPKNAVPYHNSANTYKALGQKDRAIEYFEKAILLQPGFFFSYNALADLYLTEKDYSMAKRVMERLLENSSDKVSVYFALAQICLMEKDDDAALYYLTQAKVLAPANPDIMQAIREVEYLKTTSGSKK